MKYISHRGNLTGPNPSNENNPEYIKAALKAGFDVEIDVWFVDDKFYLGHDEPQYEVKFEFFINSKLWLHAKNIEALATLKNLRYNNVFFHNIDDATLTSRGYIWTYPGKKLTKKSIALIFGVEPLEDLAVLPAGICSDYIKEYK